MALATLVLIGVAAIYNSTIRKRPIKTSLQSHSEASCRPAVITIAQYAVRIST